MRVRHFQPFFAPPDGGSGGGPAAAGAPNGAPAAPAPAPAPPAAPAAPPAGSPAAAAPPPADPAAAPPPGTAPRYVYDEDRSAWVPPDRLSQLEQTARAHEHRATTLAAMLEAGTGVQLPAPQQPVPRAIQEARQGMEQIFPGINAFYEKMQSILETHEKLEPHRDHLDRLGELTTAADFQYRGTARTMTGAILNELQQDAGGRELTPKQRGAALAHFNNWLRSDEGRVDRYLEGDRGLVNEFVADLRDFIGGFGPRGGSNASDAAAAAAAAALPPAPGQGAPPAPGGGTPPGPRSLEDRLSSSWAAMTAGRRATG